MLDISFNMPLLTDEGAKTLGSAIGSESMRRLQQMVPSATTARLLIGAGFLFGMGWLGLSFYNSYSSTSVHHTVEHRSTRRKPGAARPA